MNGFVMDAKAGTDWESKRLRIGTKERKNILQTRSKQCTRIKVY